MDISSEVLRKTVKHFISQYQDKHPAARKSLKIIANRTAASYTTIREIMNDSLQSLSLKKTLDIVSRLGGPSRPEEFFKIVDELKQKESSKLAHFANCRFYTSGLDELFGDEWCAKILWAAFGNDNITRKEIVYRWGREGEMRLEFLLHKGLLQEEDGVIKGGSSSAGVSLETTYKQLGIAYKQYDISRSLVEENWVSFQTNSVNMGFIKEFREELKKVFEKFYTKSSEKRNSGDKRIFLGMIMDRYIDDQEVQMTDEEKRKLQ